MAIGGQTPVVVEVQAAEAERTAAVGTLPAPRHRLRPVVDRHPQQRMNGVPALDELEAVVKLVLDAEILDARHDRMLAIRDGGIRFENFVLAIRAAVTAAEQ